MKKEPSNQVLTAAVLGTIAFKNNVKCAPCLDKNLLELIKESSNKKIGSSIPMLESWIEAWHNANLSTSY